ncbi:glucokinase [Olivibacter sp. SDN3]|uniref:glucokinase n=1 Tax=Olivibacter sp. SDN3 TaxID=2764720 RepID=UPI001651681F|nr:glucokinase [Olivibacter sp. SDN3]QNL49586.1 glucokinase [Olivibacter sp. SDN3]
MDTVPLYLPNQKKSRTGIKILAVDIGGTKTSLGVYNLVNGAMNLMDEITLPSSAHTSFDHILTDYLKKNISARPDVLAIGVAGPVMDGKVNLTNLSWSIDVEAIRRQHGIEEVYLLNDLEATAYGLVGIADDDLAVINTGSDQKGNMAILAPGTGLGEAGLFWDGENYRPFATEGGHSEFSPRTELDFELFQYLRDETPLISWEHLVSGKGIYRIYRFLRESKRYKEPAWLREKLENEDPAAVISHTAIRELNDTCVTAMQLFVTYMARESTSLALKLKATGGLYLGGGIPPRIYPLLKDELFREQFIQSDRMDPLLREIPIRVILNSKAALLGAAYFGAFGSRD